MPQDQPKAVVDIRNFPGLVLTIDPHLLPAGAAQVQENCMALDEGRLQPRLGTRTAEFEWSTTE